MKRQQHNIKDIRQRETHAHDRQTPAMPTVTLDDGMRPDLECSTCAATFLGTEAPEQCPKCGGLAIIRHRPMLAYLGRVGERLHEDAANGVALMSKRRKHHQSKTIIEAFYLVEILAEHIKTELLVGDAEPLTAATLQREAMRRIDQAEAARQAAALNGRCLGQEQAARAERMRIVNHLPMPSAMTAETSGEAAGEALESEAGERLMIVADETAEGVAEPLDAEGMAAELEAGGARAYHVAEHLDGRELVEYVALVSAHPEMSIIALQRWLLERGHIVGRQAIARHRQGIHGGPAMVGPGGLRFKEPGVKA